MGESYRSFAYRDIIYTPQNLSYLKHLVESLQFRCQIEILSHQRVGMICLGYTSDREDSIQECDFTLMVNMIIHAETGSLERLTLFPLVYL